jgi:Protein of unknown function, DUF547
MTPTPPEASIMSRRSSFLRLVVLAVVAVIAGAGAFASSRARAQAQAPADAGAPFAGYQSLLNDFLTTTSAKPLTTRFDYEALYIAPGRHERMAGIRRDLLERSPSSMSPKERRAWAINTYNFLVIDEVTDNLFEKRVTRGKYDGRNAYVRRAHSSVTEIYIDGFRFFDANVVEIDSARYSLNGFERHFLFDDYDRLSGKAPPASIDPRVHFALGRASRGCPPLQPRAFRADSLDAQLDAAVRSSLAHPNQFAVDSLSKVVGSELFFWYPADFGGPEKAFQFAVKNAPDSLRRAVSTRKLTRFEGNVDWDWKLNQTPSNRPAPVVKG